MKNFKSTYFLWLLGLFFCSGAMAQTVNFDYLNPDLDVNTRVDGLVKQMTTKEKISQLTHNSKAIPRLKIPKYGWWNEALHGVAYSGRATVFPQPIGLAATWNVNLLHQVAVAISDECRAKHHDFVRKDKRNNFQGLTFWAPNINIFRDPRWGRGIETYGEDPYLTGRLGVSFIQGLQGGDDFYFKVVATPKHYAVHSGPEPDRHRFDATCSDKDLYETYLPHFKEAIQEGGAYSIMSAYNRLNGASCSGHERLLTKILRDDWGFEGVVVSDCGAIKDIFAHHKIAKSEAEAAAIGLKSGCDLNCGYYYPHLAKALEEGLLTEADLDKAVRRVLLTRFRLGMFDPEGRVPYSQIGMDVVNSEENKALALLAAKESMVLLKNVNNTLPLGKGLKRIAVIGPNANDLEVLLGNYNGLPFEVSTPFEGIKKRAPEGCEVRYAQGADWAEGVHVMSDFPEGMLFTSMNGAMVKGLSAEYFDNLALKGKPVLTRIDDQIKFDWKDGSPGAAVPNDFFAARWTGVLRVPTTGKYLIGGEGHHEYKIFVNDSLFLKHSEFYHQNTKKVAPIELEAGTDYDIRVEFSVKSGDANFRLLWVPMARKLQETAVALANESDVVVLCMGLSPRLEGEELPLQIDGFAGGDRTKLKLPENQIELMKAVAKTGKPCVLVLLNGSAVAVNWANDNVAAIVDAWYPGQAAGDALAAVLFGDYNPSAKLPVTFYKSVKDLPDFEDYSMTNRTYRYFTGEPLYPFGYGLSYSMFKYSKLKLPEVAKVSESVTFTVKVKNKSRIDGQEVVQVYVTNKRTDLTVALPIRSLKGFKKVRLDGKKSAKVSFTLEPKHFAYFNELGKEVIEAGVFEVSVGGVMPGYDCPSTGVVSGLVVLK